MWIAKWEALLIGILNIFKRQTKLQIYSIEAQLVKHE
jgi:hypothetical protein